MKRHLAAIAATSLGLSLVAIFPAVPASAATSVKVGSVKCLYGPEIHTTSRAKGQVIHEIYGAWQTVQAWAVTDVRSPGYSTNYANWDVHHVWYFKNDSGGRVNGSTGVTSGSIKCA